MESRHLLAVITVNTTADENGSGPNTSLREAVAAAVSGDTINFSVTGTINLTNAGSGHITINKNLTIQGPGANLLTVRASDSDGSNNSNGRRVFLVDGSGTLNVTISGLTLTNGDPAVQDENEGGGAILNRENLTLNNCVLSGNFAPNGGAIYGTAGSLSVNDCTISDNDGGDGAGILIMGGSLTVNRSTISDNEATNSGGAILARTRPVTITDSTISGNSAEEHGGGFYQDGSSLTISGTTISGNAADDNHDDVGSGGGIYNLTGMLTITNSTISGNSSFGGGGIFSDTSQTIVINHSTITANVVASNGDNGGGIHSAETAELNHTIVAQNLRGASTRDDVEGSFDAFYSLIGDKRSENVDNTGGSLIGQNGSGSNPPIDARLGPLANNGGPTKTHALLSNSPALEAGNPSGVGGNPQYDQRGTPFSRVVNYDAVGSARIDIGAVEMTPAAPALLGDYNLNHAVDGADYVLWRKTNGGSVSQPFNGADGDGNMQVNGSDYTVWRTRFGNSQPGAGTGAQVMGDDANDYRADASSPFTTSAGTLKESPQAVRDTAIGLLLISVSGSQSTDEPQLESNSNASDESPIEELMLDLSAFELGSELHSEWASLIV